MYLQNRGDEEEFFFSFPSQKFSLSHYFTPKRAFFHYFNRKISVTNGHHTTTAIIIFFFTSSPYIHCCLQRPLSSVSKVTVVEMFGCIRQRGVTGTPVMAASLYVFGKLPSYPSPKPTLTPTSHVGQNVGLGEG